MNISVVCGKAEMMGKWHNRWDVDRERMDRPWVEELLLEKDESIWWTKLCR